MRRNLFFGILVTIIFFGTLETGLRVSGWVSTDTLRSPDLETLERIPGLFQPGQELVDRIRPELPYHIRINDLGFRGEDFEARKPRGVLRVLCLGDSYTFGHHVDDREAFPAVMQRLLRAESPNIEVVNGGANGFTIADEMIFLREKAIALNPDVVVLVFSQNDIVDLARSEPMILTMREHAALKSLFLVGPLIRVLQHTAIFNGMQRTAAWLRGRERRATHADIREGEGSEALWRVYRENLEVFHELVEDRGMGALVVAWPSARQIAGEEPPTQNERLAAEAGSLGLPFLDLTETLTTVRRSGREPTLVPLDGHPSATGHAAAAAAIAATLESEGLLVPSPKGEGM